MPIHNWKRVPAGIFHAMHHRWISAISDALNDGLLPSEFYALPEQISGDRGPDVLTLKDRKMPEVDRSTDSNLLLKAPPQVRYRAQAEVDFYRLKAKHVTVRHFSRDQIIAIIEIVSPGNQSSKRAFEQFREKVEDLLEKRIHLLLIDLFPPTPRDPHGLHAAIWEGLTEEVFTPPEDKPLTLVSYESSFPARAYIEPVAVGDPLIDMPLFLEPDAHINIPLEATYNTAFQHMPARWRDVLVK